MVQLSTHNMKQDCLLGINKSITVIIGADLPWSATLTTSNNEYRLALYRELHMAIFLLFDSECLPTVKAYSRV